MSKDITILIHDAEQVAHDLSDLLCWWEGFKTGMMLKDEYYSSIAEHGVKAAQELNILIKYKLKQDK